MYEWAEKMECAVTVCDREGTIVYMNELSRRTFEKGSPLTGANLMGCHNERSRGIIRRLLDEGGRNVYTMEKNGVHKLIFQTAWREPSGEVGGLVELSMPLPEEMPHYVR